MRIASGSEPSQQAAAGSFDAPRVMGRATISDELADRLVTAIAVGAYSPGERLPAERELAQTLGVSRDTVRQALRQVAEMGLLEVRRGRGGGSFVAEVAWQDVAPETARRTLEEELPRLVDLFDYRCMVEGMIARAAAERRTDRDIEQITAAMDDFRRSASMIEARTHDRRLHGAICAAAVNPHLMALSVQLTAAATLGFGSEPYAEEFFDRALDEHGRLIDLVVAGDADGAGDLARSHFGLTLETMRASLRQVSSAARS